MKNELIIQKAEIIFVDIYFHIKSNIKSNVIKHDFFFLIGRGKIAQKQTKDKINPPLSHKL